MLKKNERMRAARARINNQPQCARSSRESWRTAPEGASLFFYQTPPPLYFGSGSAIRNIYEQKKKALRHLKRRRRRKLSFPITSDVARVLQQWWWFIRGALAVPFCFDFLRGTRTILFDVCWREWFFSRTFERPSCSILIDWVLDLDGESFFFYPTISSATP